MSVVMGRAFKVAKSYFNGDFANRQVAHRASQQAFVRYFGPCSLKREWGRMTTPKAVETNGAQRPNPWMEGLRNYYASRRGFLRWTGRLAAAAVLAGGTAAAYGYWEAGQIQVREATISLPKLPRPFFGKRLLLLTDIHLGPLVSLAYVERLVEMANQLRPDAIALVGDFVHKDSVQSEWLPTCFRALERLEAPLGVFAVPGNHDLHRSRKAFADAIGETTLTNLTNQSMELRLEGERLWLAGVDDHWWGQPDQEAALRGISHDEAVVLLSHNPDFAEENPDARVGLVVSGHTHGGQVVLPGDGGRWIPSRYGDKYRAGLVQGPASPVFVSRGLGVTGLPIRFACPPEMNLLTLV
jgi:predicted MPP superfamily phosphohydrolase